MKRNNIVLIGFMGAGKTTIGRWISQNADMTYLDTDEYIENMQGRTIQEIFTQKDEAYFRDLETETLQKLSGSLNFCVLSAGGGMPVREENRILMKQIGVVVYLRTSEEELVRRLDGDEKRPMLKGAVLKDRIHELMLAREQAYLDGADVVIDTTGKEADSIYNEIEDFINKNF